MAGVVLVEGEEEVAEVVTQAGVEGAGGGQLALEVKGFRSLLGQQGGAEVLVLVPGDDGDGDRGGGGADFSVAQGRVGEPGLEGGGESGHQVEGFGGG